MEGTARASGSSLNKAAHNKLCVCEQSKQQLHQLIVTEDAISQKGGTPRQPMHSNAGQLY